MGNNMDKKTIDKTADIIRRYLDVEKDHTTNIFKSRSKAKAYP